MSHTNAQLDLVRESIQHLGGNLFDFFATTAEQAADGLRDEGYFVATTAEQAADGLRDEGYFVATDDSAVPDTLRTQGWFVADDETNATLQLQEAGYVVFKVDEISAEEKLRILKLLLQ